MFSSDDIKELRKKLNLKQRELATMIGVSVGTIQNYEKGGVIPESKRELLQSLSSGSLNVKGDGNITNTGVIGGGISTMDNSELMNRLIELEKEVIRLNGEVSKRDETIKGLKNELAIRIEMITFLQTKK